MKWSDISVLLRGLRTGKQCRERWYNHLDPKLKKKIPWNEEEDALLLHYQVEYGNSWTKISHHIPGRSENEVKNRWYSVLHKRKPNSSISELISAPVNTAPAGSSNVMNSLQQPLLEDSSSADSSPTPLTGNKRKHSPSLSLVSLPLLSSSTQLNENNNTSTSNILLTASSFSSFPAPPEVISSNHHHDDQLLSSPVVLTLEDTLTGGPPLPLLLQQQTSIPSTASTTICSTSVNSSITLYSMEDYEQFVQEMNNTVGIQGLYEPTLQDYLSLTSSSSSSASSSTLIEETAYLEIANHYIQSIFLQAEKQQSQQL
jgi:hypothetical protein